MISTLDIATSLAGTPLLSVTTWTGTASSEDTVPAATADGIVGLGTEPKDGIKSA